MYFSDLHVELLSKAILNPGEQLVGQTVTGYTPWWAFGLIRRTHLVLATDQRLIIIDHRFGFFPADFKLHSVDSIPWASVQELKVKGLFLKKKLRIKGMGERGPVALTAKIPNAFFGLLAPMRNNMQGARNVAAAFQGAAQLAPASNGYAPQLQQPSYPPQPQVQAAYGAPIPVQNAPGYASVPPPPVAAPQGPYGAVQQPQSFAPPSPPPANPYGRNNWS
jgi:hypothetical protein